MSYRPEWSIGMRQIAPGIWLRFSSPKEIHVDGPIVAKCENPTTPQLMAVEERVQKTLRRLDIRGVGHTMMIYGPAGPSQR